MIDLVYPLGTGSIWQDREIKYSLRSVEKHLTNYRNIYIVGQKPSFLKNIIHIPFEDTQGNKESNIKAKIAYMCTVEQLSDDFLFMNDDHFLNSDFDATTFPYYYKGTMENMLSRNRRGVYWRAVLRTFQLLRTQNKPTLYFDTHCPIIYNKNKFLQVVNKQDWSGRIGIVIKSLYCNSLGIDGIKQVDCKINKLCIASELTSLINDKKFWSIGNKALNDQLEIVLRELYPTPSRWEIT